ncbi:NADPH-dependent FMN reductase [Lactobacillus xylocopicola]|uniref:Oxidoreductase n=1 Tax=Lactobacillus xylocopicola TaxID=2976676 RepID=A0ABM8BFC6_9LACO|nr:NAD(P)H-dependent oxidoreductase [Lactobacillus xylocopicola]BDR59942.1 oxidoreductase [Lactobacillus xylocopicola]
MKILALSGSNANNSFNEALLKYITKHFAAKYDFKLATVKGIPMFKEGESIPAAVQTLAQEIEDADLVLIGSPEQQHSVTSATSSALEWLSSDIHPFKGKPVALVSTSPMPQGAARSQSRLKSLLTAPGFGAVVFNGDEFMMGTAPAQFDDNGDLKDKSTIEFLGHFFDEVDEWYAQVTK